MFERADWTRYAERYERWLAGAAHPRLVREIWLFAPNHLPRRFDPGSRGFVEQSLPASLGPLWSDVQKAFAAPAGLHALGFPQAIREDIPAVVAPVPRVVSLQSDRNLRIERIDPLAHRGYTVIVFAEPYITRELLPELATRSFGPAGTSDYHVSVRSRSGAREVFSYGPPVQNAVGRPDVARSLFEIRLETIADLRSAALGSGKAEGVLPGAAAPFLVASGKPGSPPPQETLARAHGGRMTVGRAPERAACSPFTCHSCSVKRTRLRHTP